MRNIDVFKRAARTGHQRAMTLLRAQNIAW
jgi:hypothetical protein